MGAEPNALNDRASARSTLEQIFHADTGGVEQAGRVLDAALEVLLVEAVLEVDLRRVRLREEGDGPRSRKVIRADAGENRRGVVLLDRVVVLEGLRAEIL